MPDRELGGYTSSVGLPGAGTTVREIDVIISPAAGTTLQLVEQTFTVPGVLATDRLIGLTTTTGSPQTGSTSGIIFPLAGRVSAISIVSIPFETPGTAATPTASTTYAFFIASARVIP